MELVQELAQLLLDLALVWLAWENLKKGEQLRELEREVRDLRGVIDQEAECGDGKARCLD